MTTEHRLLVNNGLTESSYEHWVVATFTTDEEVQAAKTTWENWHKAAVAFRSQWDFHDCRQDPAFREWLLANPAPFSSFHDPEEDDTPYWESRLLHMHGCGIDRVGQL